MCSCARKKKDQVDRHKDDLCHKKIYKYPGISGFNLAIYEKLDMRIMEIIEGFKLFWSILRFPRNLLNKALENSYVN